MREMPMAVDYEYIDIVQYMCSFVEKQNVYLWRCINFF